MYYSQFSIIFLRLSETHIVSSWSIRTDRLHYAINMSAFGQKKTDHCILTKISVSTQKKFINSEIHCLLISSIRAYKKRTLLNNTFCAVNKTNFVIYYYIVLINRFHITIKKESIYENETVFDY